ncbi:MAG: TCR/Tet family MFS transporter [Phycisphaerales bacterium]
MGKTARTARLGLIFFTILLDALGIGLIIPVGPKLVAWVQHLPTQGAESESSLAYGLLTAMYAAMLFVFAPILGSLSDHFGRRPIILISLAGSALDYFAAALMTVYFPSLVLLFITRAINGISGANITACNAYIADVTPPDKRSAGYAVLGAAFGIGFMFGPLVGGLLGDPDVHIPFIGPGDIHYPFLAAGILCSLNWLYGLFVLPESLKPENRRAVTFSKANPFGVFKWLSGHRVVIILACALFLLYVAQFSLHATWVLSLSMRFKWTPEQLGWSLFVVGIGAVIVQGGLARKIIPALGERLCLLIGVLLAVLAFAGYGLATQGWMIYAIVAVASFGGVSGPAAQGVVSKAVLPSEQGMLQGALSGLQSVAAVVGPLLGTGVFRYFTRDGADVVLPGAPFLVGSALCALALIPVGLVWSRMPTSVAQMPDEEADETHDAG